VITFRLDPSSGVPTYLQLVQQVEHALRVGQLVVGDQLPLVREVVSDLAINPNTVLKAYRDLESKGLTEGRPGSGTFVRAALGDVPAVSYGSLTRRAERWINRARAEGLDDRTITAVFASALHNSAGQSVA
jgi:GntR family transcriptional regulator